MKVDQIEPWEESRKATFDINEIRDKKAGKRVFLLGNGPPLHEWTMEDIKGLGADTIGMNRSWRPRLDPKDPNEIIHKGFQGTTYHCFVSGAHGYALCDGKVKTGLAICPKNLRWLIDSAECGSGCRCCFIGVLNGGYAPTNFTFDLNRGVMTKFAGYFALQLAAWCGYDEIYLLGYSAQDREGHAFEADPSKGLVTRQGMRRWFSGAADWANSRRGKLIVNCDEGSAISAFPKMSKKQVFERIKAADNKDATL